MPERRTVERAREDAREGKAPSTQAGEFVREEIDHVREGKHGVRNPKQAIAIGLSKARKAGIKVPPPPRGSASAKKQKRAGRKRTSRDFAEAFAGNDSGFEARGPFWRVHQALSAKLNRRPERAARGEQLGKRAHPAESRLKPSAAHEC